MVLLEYIVALCFVDSSEARAVGSLSWIEALEKVNQSLWEPRTKVSGRVGGEVIILLFYRGVPEIY